MVRFQYVPYDYETSGGYGKKCFWCILLDGQERWPNARPFSASDDAIVLNECLECATCGTRGTWVRRVLDKVVWLASQDKDGVPVLLPGDVLVFDAAEYQAALAQGSISQLPELRVCELQRLLDNVSVPSSDLAIYREPSAPDDQYGDMMLTWLREFLNGRHGELRACETPTSFVESRIGLELPGTPELVWWAPDLVTNQPLLLRANPSFPLWLHAG